jgi:WD40 repeat protein
MLKVFAQHRRAISDMAFSPDGKHLAVLGFENTLHVYDVATGAITARLDCPCLDMRTLAYSADGELLAAAGRNGRVRTWRMSDGSVAFQGQVHSQRIRDLVFSPDRSLLITASEDRSICATNTVTGQQVFVLPTGACKVYCLAILPDGRLASAGSDNRITLWDLQRREAVSSLEGHTGTVTALALDGETLVSVSYDTTLRLWPTHPVPAIAERPVQEANAKKPTAGAR